jgi:histidinol phosphatase-like PHP family hydrolase
VGAERESVLDGFTLAAPAAGLDLRADGHVHTGFAAGRDSVGVIVTAADFAGLTCVTFADQAGTDTSWLPAYADTIRRARQRTELTLRVAAEVEVVRQDGWLAWPADLDQLEVVSVAVSRLPLADGTAAPRDVRAMLAAGRLTPEQVAEIVVTATIKGMERASRYSPVQLARPLSLLAQVGIDEAAATPELVGALAAACRLTGAAVEISEAWRCPSPRVVAMLREADVALVAVSDARYAGEVGHWRYVRGV